MDFYLKLVNEVVVDTTWSTSPPIGDGWHIYPEEFLGTGLTYGDAGYGDPVQWVLKPRDPNNAPYPFYEWDTIQKKFIVNDQEAFNDAVKDFAKYLRDQNIPETIEYSGVLAKNTIEEMSLIGQLKSIIEAKGENVVIDWKQPNGVYTDVTYEIFQGLFLEMENIQKAYKAERHVIEYHDLTPFEDISDVQIEFNNFFETL